MAVPFQTLRCVFSWRFAMLLLFLQYVHLGSYPSLSLHTSTLASPFHSFLSFWSQYHSRKNKFLLFPTKSGDEVEPWLSLLQLVSTWPWSAAAFQARTPLGGCAIIISAYVCSNQPTELAAACTRRATYRTLTKSMLNWAPSIIFRSGIDCCVPWSLRCDWRPANGAYRSEAYLRTICEASDSAPTTLTRTDCRTNWRTAKSFISHTNLWGTGIIICA